MRDNFLRDAKVSQFELFVWCANLAAFFCTLSNVCVKKSLLLDLMRWGSLKKIEHLQDIDVDWRAILNLSSWNKLRGCGVWSGLIWLETGTRGLFL